MLEKKGKRENNESTWCIGGTVSKNIEWQPCKMPQFKTFWQIYQYKTTPYDVFDGPCPMRVREHQLSVLAWNRLIFHPHNAPGTLAT